MSTRYASAIRASLLILSFVFFGLTACSSVAPKPVVVDTQAKELGPINPELQQSFSEALVLLRDQKFIEAEQQLLLITAKYPSFAGPWTNLAIAQNRQEKYEDALDSVELALQQDANFCQAIALKGLIFRELGHFTQAKEQYQQAMVCNPNDTLSLYNLGVLSDLYLHDEPAALHYYQRYLANFTSPDESLDSDNEADQSTMTKELKMVESWVVDLKRRVPEEDRIKLEVEKPIEKPVQKTVQKTVQKQIEEQAESKSAEVLAAQSKEVLAAQSKEVPEVQSAVKSEGKSK